MTDSGTTKIGIGRTVRDFLIVFSPLILTPFVLILALRFHHPWMGMFVFGGIALARKWWWSCVFGLLNAVVIFAGFIGCAVAVFKRIAR